MNVWKERSKKARKGGKMEVRKERMEEDRREGSKEVGRKPNKDCLSKGRGSKASVKNCPLLCLHFLKKLFM